MFSLSLSQDPVFLSCLLAAFLAQLSKLLIRFVKSKRLDISLLWATGGMPSSHSALVSALSISVFVSEGFSTLFMVSLVFSLIVIRDAMGVRVDVGKIAGAVNMLLKKTKVKKGALNEKTGHRPSQVIIGAVIGLAVALLVHFLMLVQII